MALCDELEAKLNQSQTDGAKLMEVVVAGLIKHNENMLSLKSFLTMFYIEQAEV